MNNRITDFKLLISKLTFISIIQQKTQGSELRIYNELRKIHQNSPDMLADELGLKMVKFMVHEAFTDDSLNHQDGKYKHASQPECLILVQYLKCSFNYICVIILKENLVTYTVKSRAVSFPYKDFPPTFEEDAEQNEKFVISKKIMDVVATSSQLLTDASSTPASSDES